MHVVDPAQDPAAPIIAAQRLDLLLQTPVASRDENRLEQLLYFVERVDYPARLSPTCAPEQDQNHREIGPDSQASANCRLVRQGSERRIDRLAARQDLGARDARGLELGGRITRSGDVKIDLGLSPGAVGVYSGHDRDEPEASRHFAFEHGRELAHPNLRSDHDISAERLDIAEQGLRAPAVEPAGTARARPVLDAFDPAPEAGPVA